MSIGLIEILIVDDDPAHVEAVRRALISSDTRFRVEVATSLAEFRRKAVCNAPDIAIMDLNLPDGRAVEVMTNPAESGAFPILLMTSFGNEKVAVEAIKSGAIDYIVKSPEAFAAMPRTVVRALREWHLLLDRKRAALDMRESEARFHTISSQFNTLLDELPDLFVLHDTDLRIIWLNKAAASLCHGDMASRNAQCYSFVCQEQAPCSPCPVAKSIETGVATMEIVTTCTGKVLELRAIPIREQGRVVSVIEVCRDITEQRRLEEQLRQTQKMEAIGRLAGGVAHDFNNLLLVIMGYTDMAINRLPTGSTHVSGYLQEVMNAANHSAELTKQLLAFSRKQTVEQKVVHLNRLVTGQLKMLNRLIGEDIELNFAAGSDLWPVLIDPSQVDQMLLNLIVNARDSIGGGGCISIETANVSLDQAYSRAHPDALPGEYVRLSVSDTGCGMDTGILDRIFEPFFTTKEKGKGTGLGLATVYGVVTQNSGEIHAESVQSEGTRFFLHLPRYTGSQLEHGRETRRMPPVGNEVVLLVEDNVQSLALTGLMLEECGYTVMATASPLEACELCAKHPGEIALLLSDVIMPQLNGRELSARITTLRPGIKTLFMSGYTDDIISKRGIITEGLNFIHKPFVLMGLADRVRVVLDEKSALSEGGSGGPEKLDWRACTSNQQTSRPSS
jgi:two-component system, cell cycle sensor histidine kinase and response regulator CckA